MARLNLASNPLQIQKLTGIQDRVLDGIGNPAKKLFAITRSPPLHAAADLASIRVPVLVELLLKPYLNNSG
jgi:hypothetical protein